MGGRVWSSNLDTFCVNLYRFTFLRENLVTKTPVMITEMTKEVHAVDGAATKAMAIFRLLLQDYHPRDFAISFWDGSRWPAENGTRSFYADGQTSGCIAADVKDQRQ